MTTGAEYLTVVISEGLSKAKEEAVRKLTFRRNRFVIFISSTLKTEVKKIEKTVHRLVESETRSHEIFSMMMFEMNTIVENESALPANVPPKRTAEMSSVVFVPIDKEL